jgi:hypothetical protein
MPMLNYQAHKLNMGDDSGVISSALKNLITQRRPTFQEVMAAKENDGSLGAVWSDIEAAFHASFGQRWFSPAYRHEQDRLLAEYWSVMTKKLAIDGVEGLLDLSSEDAGNGFLLFPEDPDTMIEYAGLYLMACCKYVPGVGKNSKPRMRTIRLRGTILKFWISRMYRKRERQPSLQDYDLRMSEVLHACAAVGGFNTEPVQKTWLGRDEMRQLIDYDVRLSPQTML